MSPNEAHTLAASLAATLMVVIVVALHASSDVRSSFIRCRGEDRVMLAEKTELALRIVVDDPVPGVALARGRGDSLRGRRF